MLQCVTEIPPVVQRSVYTLHVFVALLLFTEDYAKSRERESKGMLMYSPDPLPPVVCLMEEDVPPNPFCSAPPHSDPPPPLPSLSSTTPRYCLQHLFLSVSYVCVFTPPLPNSAELSPSPYWINYSDYSKSSSSIRLLLQPEGA